MQGKNMSLKGLMWHYVTIEYQPGKDSLVDKSGAVDRQYWPKYHNVSCNIQTLNLAQRRDVVVKYNVKEAEVSHAFYFDTFGLLVDASCRLVTALDYRNTVTEQMLADPTQILIYQIIGFGEPVRKRNRSFSLRELYAFETKRWSI